MEYQRRTAQLASVKTDYELANQLTEHHQSLKDISDAKLKRHLDLYQNKMVSDEVLDEARRIASERSMTLAQHLARVTDFPNQIAQAEAAVTEAGAMLEQARINLEQTTLQAPFRGRIIALNVAPGDRVFQGTTLVQIADYDQLEVRATIPADQGARLRTQLEAGAKVSARGRLHGQQIRFVLDRISGDVKPGQAGIDGFFRPEADQQLDIGRVINLHVTLPAEEQVLALPVQSLYENDRIYRVVDSRLQGLDVERVGDHITAEGEYRVLIRSEAIDAGDRLITTQLPRAITGLLVEPIDASEFVQAVAGKDSGQ